VAPLQTRREREKGRGKGGKKKKREIGAGAKLPCKREWGVPSTEGTRTAARNRAKNPHQKEKGGAAVGKSQLGVKIKVRGHFEEASEKGGELEARGQ